MDRDRDSSSQGSKEIEGNLTERLRNVLLDQSEGDLLMDNGNGVEIGLIRWLRALDLQVIGACRADERLKPLLKIDISNGFAEDRLLNQFAQHFEASEVGMLARCLCAPLVSIRVGKVNKQGKLLCPSPARGHLDLILLPSSNLRISFVGDDGVTERVGVVSSSSEVSIEEISADTSGRTFHITAPGNHVFYFWCSDKSKPRGMQLLAKMKDVIRRKPGLSELTGISEARLQSFASHLRTYLLTSSNPPEQPSTPLPASARPPTAPTQAHPVVKRPLSQKPVPFKEKPIQHTSETKLPIVPPPHVLEFPPPPDIIPSKSMFSPCYCWCPLPPPSITIAPLSSRPQVMSKSPFDVPKLLPFMSDPIVHTPVIDICSSGYGPTMTSPVFVGRPLGPGPESAAEKSARETLRLLMASTPPFACLKNNSGDTSPTFPVKESEGNGESLASSRDVDLNAMLEEISVEKSDALGCKSVDDVDLLNHSEKK